MVVLLVSIFPLIYSLITSFMSMRLIPPMPPRFVGFDNYTELLQSARFWTTIGTTSLIAFTSVALQFVLGFALALAINSKLPGDHFFRTGFLLPMFMAPVAVALVARMIFNPTMGPLNQLLTSFGLPYLPFLTETNWALAVIIAVEVWQWTPFMMLMLLAGLQTLPRDVYEAAELENATPWQQFRGITFPMMLPVSAAVVFIRLIEGYKIMDTVFVMTGGGPGISTETLTLFAYQEGFKKFNLGNAAALSFLFLIVITMIGMVYLAILRPLLRKYK